MKFLSKIYILFLLLSFSVLNAQDYQARQKKLEAQKISLKKEIIQINSLIEDSRRRSKNLANELEDLQLKISVRDKLININNSQLNNLTSIIENHFPENLTFPMEIPANYKIKTLDEILK